ncbi:MAG: DUF1295 domain-containing protein [Phycisphaerae bacterium]|nr:DUF1295 domain-containing protein [Phycisphaerae bacterium]
MYDLQRQGLWLFQRRSYLPFVTIVLFASGLRSYTYPLQSGTADALLECLCFIIALIGEGIRLHVAGHAPKGTSGRTTTRPKAAQLNTTGMYSIVRNPLYLGNMLIWAGITLFLHSILFTCAALGLFLLYYERIILSEEALLRDRFGDAFNQWAARTPMLVPDPRKWVDSNLPFCWRTALKREYSGFLVIAAAMTALEVAGDVFYKGVFRLEWPWAVILCAGAVIYLPLRTLKKAGVLDVAGR